MIVGWVLAGLQGVLAVAMLAAGGMKLVGHDRVVEEFERYDYSMGFMRLTGAFEAVASIALIAGFVFRPVVAVAGGATAFAVMSGALVTHVRVSDPFSEAAPAVVLFLVATVVTAGIATTTGLIPL